MAAALLALSVAIAWLATGVRVDELARFAAYEGLYVLAPGLIAYRALLGATGGAIRQLAIGWTIGYALEVLAFTATGVTETRDAFWIYPVIVLAIAGPFALRRSRADAEPDPESDSEDRPAGPLALVLVVSAVAVAYLALGFYTQTPIPDRIDSAGYYADTPFHLSVAAEAKHHWPIEQPNVAGEELNYHIHGYLHMAAISDVTGVELPVVVYRFFHVPLLVLSALLLFVLGRQLSGSAWVGALAAALIFLGGELDLDPNLSSPLSGDLLESSILSPTILFSMPFFLAATVLASDLLVSERRHRWGTWGSLAIVLYGVAGAKGTALPVLAVGLGCFLLWRIARERRLDRPAAGILGLVVLALALSVALLYEDSGEAFELSPFAHLLDFSVIGSEAGDGLPATVLSAVFTALALALSMLGIGWLLTREGRRVLGPRHVWLLSLLAAGLLPFLVVDQSGDAQVYFLYYGLMAGAVVSAHGLTLFWREWSSSQQDPGPRLGALVLLALAAVAAATAVAFATDLAVVDRVAALTDVSSDLSLLDRYAVELAAAVAAVAVAVLVARRLSPPDGRSRAASFGLAVVIVISLGLLDSPLDFGSRPVRAWINDTPAHFEPTPAVAGVNRPLVEGLEWIRDNTDEDAVLAVNNQTLDEAEQVPKYFHYSALAERRIFLEGWEYTDIAQQVGKEAIQSGEHAFPERKRLNDEAFEGDPAALRELGRRGVDYLVVDRVNGDEPPPALAQADSVYSSSAIGVYRLEGALIDAARRARCRQAGQRAARRAPSSAPAGRGGRSPGGC